MKKCCARFKTVKNVLKFLPNKGILLMTSISSLVWIGYAVVTWFKTGW